MQEDYGITDIGTFIHDDGDQIYRYLVLKKIFTPLEQKECYMDESIYEDGGHYSFAHITNAILIPGNVLLELEELFDDTFEPTGQVSYRRLSDIQLFKFAIDNEKKA